MDKVLIIAEAGVNHNGSIEIAKKMVDTAKMVGADAIKFQTFIAEKLVSKNAKKATYQIENTQNEDESQLAMLKELELSFQDFFDLKQYCDEKEIIFLSTAFDMESLSFLNTLDMPFYKIPSGEITNLPYLEAIGKTGKKVILSTGMASLSEIQESIDVLRANGADDIVLLHCTTEYPAPIDEVNLKAMNTLKEKFGVEVGYSDHTKGIFVPVAAVARGAKIIEKHFTLDNLMEGPDHIASLEPIEFKNMVDAIRLVERALGNGNKEPTNSELRNLIVARKSIVASRKINCGESFTVNNITVKRPGTGISPMQWYAVLGLCAKRDFEEDELIEI